MARKKISAAFRKRLSEKLMDLGNLVIVGLVIGQFEYGKKISIPIIIAGLIIAGICYISSYIVDP